MWKVYKKEGLKPIVTDRLKKDGELIEQTIQYPMP